jgi:hypothetical protein
VSYIKIAAYLAIAGLLACAGWTVAVWRNKAARADDLAVLYQGALDARVKADAKTRAVERERDASRAHAAQLETEAKEAKTHEKIRTITKQVVVRVPEDIRCDLNDDVVELLNRARSPEPAVSAPAADPAPATPEPAASSSWNPF